MPQRQQRGLAARPRQVRSVASSKDHNSADTVPEQVHDKHKLRQLVTEETAARKALGDLFTCEREAKKNEQERHWVESWKAQQAREDKQGKQGGQQLSTRNATQEKKENQKNPTVKPTIGFSLLDTVDLSGQPMITVTNVNHGSPAGLAGMQEGDILLAYKGTKITTVDEFRPLYSGASRNDQVEVTFKRIDQATGVENTLKRTMLLQ
eukprot:TRINITY_DN24019_c0_g1_i3.p2 TRINITY_DN24019_c0_g1~~TRINITY_DN24019_c0_g1_i3.p2  ORF type:complete len:208 (+),score=25.89 TRINITY_DN24019_c0_g1_i3:158-781(+)